jgi:hypothetical protein
MSASFHNADRRTHRRIMLVVRRRLVTASLEKCDRRDKGGETVVAKSKATRQSITVYSTGIDLAADGGITQV